MSPAVPLNVLNTEKNFKRDLLYKENLFRLYKSFSKVSIMDLMQFLYL